MYIVLGIIIVLVIIVGFITHYFLGQVITRVPDTEEQMIESQLERKLFDKEFYDNLPKEDIILRSKDGLKLRGIFIENNSDKTMVFVHGITVGLIWSIKYIDMFINRGWNVLIYDQRRHGQSEGKYSTFGYYEKEDLDLWVNWVVDRKGKDSIIGLHGESMGAATVLQYLDINKHVKFAIADCPYSDMRELLKGKLAQYKGFLDPILPICNIITKRRAKFDFDWVKPIECVRKSEIPVMFAHGDEDTFVPWHMSEDMYEAKTKGLKKIYIAKGAAHARAIEVDKALYEKEVMEFVDEALSSLK